MSVVRHDRRGSRANQASPYARPSRKSSWSFSNLLSFLNPLRFRGSSDERELEISSQRSSLSSNSAEAVNTNKAAVLPTSSYQTDAAHIHTVRQEPSQDRHLQTSATSRSPPKRSALHLDDIDDSSPAKNLEIVTKFLEERGGKPMSSVELEGVISLIRKSTPSEKPEPFRFSSSASPTPGKDDSPDGTRGHSPVGNGINQGPRKMLTKNPNGVYRWRGGGSARPARSRNRYASPAFGPSRSTPERLVLKESTATGEGLRTDNKRRRIGEEASLSSVSSFASSTNSPAVIQTPSDSPNPKTGTIPSAASPRLTNGTNAQPKTNGTPNGAPLFRVRSTGLQKPTTPAVPSPLRQAWSGSSSDVSPSPEQVPTKPTKVASLMAELIKEVTPPKKPDVSNPYQTASPVKVSSSASRPKPKRARVKGKSAATASEKMDTDTDAKGEEIATEKVTPQAIIEATLPKGSKRARPPTHFEKPASTEPISIASVETTEDPSQVRSSTRLSPPRGTRPDTAYTVEEAEEDEEAKARVTKRMKPYLNGRGAERRAPHNDIVVEEVKDVEMGYANERPAVKTASSSTGVATAASTKILFGHKPTSVPKEPSKLRYSYQPEPTTLAAPSTAPLITLSPVVNKESEDLSDVHATLTASPDPKAKVLALPPTVLPTFMFTFAAAFNLTPAEKMAREQAGSKADASLPTFILSQRPEANSSTKAAAGGFDWSAAGVKPPTTLSGNWTCSVCMLSNPVSATEKCTICETPRSQKPVPSQKLEINSSVGTVAPTLTKTFDWSAAGIKPPVPVNGNWTCSTCMLSNPASATEKCTICETPR